MNHHLDDLHGACSHKQLLSLPASVHSYCDSEAFLPLSWVALVLFDEAALSCAAQVIKAPMGWRGA